MSPRTRILCLGNEVLADDAFGFVVAERIQRTFPHLDVVATANTGLHLIDNLTDIDRLVVVDGIQTGNVPPGTLYVLRSSDMKSGFGSSPHYVGLLETLQLARELLLDVPEDVIILAVEVADCLTLGGAMHDAVKSAVDLVTELVAALALTAKPEGNGHQQDSGDGFGRAIVTVTARWGSKRLVVI